ncbi:MAG: alkaline phosphatase family protein, partial [Gammaproteobacteria bacterium]|nr:alkaline phosphatase family protein [Gammaproteobacteria bacterium]
MDAWMRLIVCWFSCAVMLWCGAASANTLVLVSIDGFRWDYLDRSEASVMRSLANKGTRVMKLRTVYPSKTFPAHLSLATGLRPTGHGVVDNYFCRNDRPDCYNMGNGRKDPDWLSGIPLWTLVEMQGGRASTFFWPESDAKFSGILPTDYRTYDGRTPHADRVNQVLEWLALPAGERPALVTLYFSAVDSAGHTFGPNAPQTLSAISDVDAWIGRLWSGIETINRERDARINLLLVSDHGMARVEPDHFIDTNTLPRPAGFKRVNGSTRVMYYQRDADADIEALKSELSAMSGGRYWQLTAEILAQRHYDQHPAVADLIIETRPPHVFRRGGGEGANLLGMHGYPASEEDMASF